MTMSDKPKLNAADFGKVDFIPDELGGHIEYAGKKWVPIGQWQDARQAGIAALQAWGDRGETIRSLQQSLAEAGDAMCKLVAERAELREALQQFTEPMRRYRKHASWTKGDEELLIAASENAAAVLEEGK